MLEKRSKIEEESKNYYHNTGYSRTFKYPIRGK